MENQVGYGLRPNDEELVGHYLLNKINGETSLVEGAINEVNICSEDPWNLRFKSKYKSTDPMWYFFSRRENKYGSGNQQKRTTFSGKWKLTGDPVEVKDQWGNWCGTPGKKIGYKRVLVFLDSRNSVKTKSDWVIHEFHCELFPEHLRSYVICRLEYKGNDWSILAANATHPTPNITNSAGSVVNQSGQGYSGSYNTENDSPNQVHQFNENINMQQPVQGSLGSFNHPSQYASPNQVQQFNENINMQQPVQGNLGSLNHSSQYASANHGQQFGGNYNNMHQSVGGGYLENFNHSSEFDQPSYGHWFSDYLFNPQQSVPYSDPSVDELGKILRPIIEENLDSFVPERTYMQEHYSDHRPKKPVTGFIADASSDSETDSTIFGDTSSSTDSVGSSNEPDHTSIDDIPSLVTIESLHNYEAQEQPKQRKLHLQGKQKVINTQKSECEWKMAEDSIKKTPSTNTVKQSWIVLDKMSQRKSQWNYLKNMIIGVFLFISIIGWIILVG